MKKVLRGLGIAVVVLLLMVGVGYVWATSASNRILARSLTAHEVEFPVPFPVPAEEAGQLGMSEEQAAEVARTRAVERGRHLVETRYACTECHGADFSGGVMIDAFPIGTIMGPNLTGGVGSRTASFTVADWDRIVRHGILPGGLPAAMPAEDFRLMSDQELSDIIAYIRSLPRVDNTVAPRSLGPLGRVLVATGQLPLSADLIESHDEPHRDVPPPAAVTVEFGAHLAATCSGCHGMEFAGGPITGGDPSWAPARNLTPHESGLGSWTVDDFKRAMREGVRPDGTALLPPMSMVVTFSNRMTDVELEAIWTYLRSLPALPTGA